MAAAHCCRRNHRKVKPDKRLADGGSGQAQGATSSGRHLRTDDRRGLGPLRAGDLSLEEQMRIVRLDRDQPSEYANKGQAGRRGSAKQVRGGGDSDDDSGMSRDNRPRALEILPEEVGEVVRLGACDNEVLNSAFSPRLFGCSRTFSGGFANFAKDTAVFDCFDIFGTGVETGFDMAKELHSGS